MAKRSSVLAHSKQIERLAARFFFGDGAKRDWKEEWDVTGTVNGIAYVLEVKTAKLDTVGALLRLLHDALAQAEGYVKRYHLRAVPVGAVWPKRARTRLAALRVNGRVIIMTWDDLREEMYSSERTFIQ